MQGADLYKSCSSVDSSLLGTKITRQCSEKGNWEEINYSECTIESDSSSFLLLWIVIEAGSEDKHQIEDSKESLESEVGLYRQVHKDMKFNIYPLLCS